MTKEQMGERPDMEAGDVFCVGKKTILSRAIQFSTKISSTDNRSEFGHSGIITSGAGKTIEALWTVRNNDLAAYNGDRMIIARPAETLDRMGVSVEDKAAALADVISDHLGRIYPAWRIPLHLVPPLAKYFSIGGRWLVCSELVAKYLSLLETHDKVITGINPDHLGDMFRNYRTFEVVFDGVWRW